MASEIALKAALDGNHSLLKSKRPLFLSLCTRTLARRFCGMYEFRVDWSGCKSSKTFRMEKPLRFFQANFDFALLQNVYMYLGI
jgi:hypothetical protein